MPRRSQIPPQFPVSASPQPDAPHYNLAVLRTQWRWAAFSQFFFTFSPLFAMNDVSIADIEQDLTFGTKLVIPRVMQRMLYTLSYDRKVSVDNWQTALRKQYNKRDPHANPIGPEPVSIYPFPDEDEDMKGDVEGNLAEDGVKDETVQNGEELRGGERDTSPTGAMSTSAEPIPSELASQKELNSTRQSSYAVEGRASSLLGNMADGAEQQKSIDWFELPMLAKLESMHTLAEWQFQKPTRLRMIMKSDDELASWRIEPIGYDSKRNAYWLIGTDRLWIQRVPPKAPKAKGLKRKRPATKTKAQASKASTKNAKRLKLTVAETPAKRGAVVISLPASGRHSRAAKDQAKMKLDAQARELAELNRQAGLASKSRRSRQSTLKSQPSITPTRGVGTRLSARLRGAQDDEWQPVPDEWLEEGPSTRSVGKRKAPLKTGLESDQESTSELTELSDEGSDDESQPAKGATNGKAAAKDEDEDPELEDENQTLPDDFVEWELICSTLYEWEHISDRFQKAFHYTEKALYKILVNEVVPAIMEDLKEIERKRQLEEALVHRKRSSRLAVRENEKEEARLATQKKQEEDEKMSRARRLEVRQQKEEAERLKREHGREQRRQEREAREESRKAQVAAEEAKAAAKAKAKDQPKKRKSSSPSREPQKPRAHKNGERKANAKQGTSSGSRTPAGEDWELACEICQRQGINLDDGSPVVSCGVCSRWQHIQCHDRADRLAGRPRRNWNSEDFICSRCRATQRVQYNNNYHPVSKPLPAMNVPQVQPYGYQPIAPVNPQSVYPQDHRSSAHGYRDSTQQSYYARPSNGQQYPNAQSQYAQAPSGQSTISFSHYQPTQQGFSASGQKPYADSHYPYGHPSSSSQHYRQEPMPPYKPQLQVSAWTSNPPAQASGYSMPHNGSIGPTSSSSYRQPPPENRDNQPLHSYPSHETSQTSYSRYPADAPHYPQTQFKHHPTSYQPPFG